MEAGAGRVAGVYTARSGLKYLIGNVRSNGWDGDIIAARYFLSESEQNAKHIKHRHCSSVNRKLEDEIL